MNTKDFIDQQTARAGIQHRWADYCSCGARPVSVRSDVIMEYWKDTQGRMHAMTSTGPMCDDCYAKTVSGKQEARQRTWWGRLLNSF